MLDAVLRLTTGLADWRAAADECFVATCRRNRRSIACRNCCVLCRNRCVLCRSRCVLCRNRRRNLMATLTKCLRTKLFVWLTLLKHVRVGNQGPKPNNLFYPQTVDKRRRTVRLADGWVCRNGSSECFRFGSGKWMGNSNHGVNWQNNPVAINSRMGQPQGSRRAVTGEPQGSPKAAIMAHITSNFNNFRHYGLLYAHAKRATHKRLLCVA